MKAEYDADEKVLLEDINAVIEKLKSINALIPEEKPEKK